MTKTSTYLEAAKVEEIAADLRKQGFDVIERPAGLDAGYDLVATKGGKRIAFAVKARSNLAGRAEEIVQLREQAKSRGIDEFRLVLVAPPKRVHAEIEGFSEALHQFMADNVPPELNALSSQTTITSVSDYEITLLDIQKDGVRVAGSGTVDVELEYGGGKERDGVTSSDSFPFTFELELDHDLTVREDRDLRLNVDVSSFYQ